MSFQRARALPPHTHRAALAAVILQMGTTVAMSEPRSSSKVTKFTQVIQDRRRWGNRRHGASTPKKAAVTSSERLPPPGRESNSCLDNTGLVKGA